MEPLDARALPGVRVGILAREQRRDRVHLRLRGRERRASAQPPDDSQVARVAQRPQVHVHGDRDLRQVVLGPQPHFRLARKAEAGRHDAHDARELLVELQLAPDDRGVGAEALAPERVPQNHLAGSVLRGSERPSQGGLRAEQLEQVRGGDPGVHPARGVALDERAPDDLVGGEALEGTRALAPVQEIGRSHRAVRLARVGLVHEHQPVRVGVGQRPQQQGVERRQHCGVAADPERERQRGNEREPRRAPQPPHSVPQIQEQRVHEPKSSEE